MFLEALHSEKYELLLYCYETPAGLQDNSLLRREIMIAEVFHIFEASFFFFSSSVSGCNTAVLPCLCNYDIFCCLLCFLTVTNRKHSLNIPLAVAEQSKEMYCSFFQHKSLFLIVCFTFSATNSCQFCIVVLRIKSLIAPLLSKDYIT